MCVATRKPHTDHRGLNDSDEVTPVLVADYCFVKTSGDSSTQTVQVLSPYPYNMYHGIAIPKKDLIPTVVRCMANCIRVLGVLEPSNLGGRELARIAMLESAVLDFARGGIIVFNDEGPQPDTSEMAQDEEDETCIPTEPFQDPGRTMTQCRCARSVPPRRISIERARRTCCSDDVCVGGGVGTLMSALHAQSEIPIPCHHPNLAWVIHVGSYVLNRYQLGTDDRSAWGRLHGVEARGRTSQFGERNLWHAPHPKNDTSDAEP